MRETRIQIFTLPLHFGGDLEPATTSQPTLDTRVVVRIKRGGGVLSMLP